MQVYQQQVQLVFSLWPPTKISELVTRLILNTTGPAFAKLQLHREELCINDEKGVKLLMELLGGHWGQIGLERRYSDAEKALFQCSQHADESNDSFLGRADILWTRLLSQKMQSEDLQCRHMSPLEAQCCQARRRNESFWIVTIRWKENSRW